MTSPHRALATWLALVPTACLPGASDAVPAAAALPGEAARPRAGAVAVDHLRLDAPLPGDPLGVTVHRLGNGITVWLSPDPARPRVSAWVAVRAGSRHDPPASTGLAHYLEHMLFKGTDELGTLDAAAEAADLERTAELYRRLRAEPDVAARRATLKEIDALTQRVAAVAIPNELDRLYAALGITGVNAFTSDEETVYVADVPAPRLAAWAEVEAERLRDPVFRLFFPELEAVYEEKNLALDSAEDRTLEALLLALFPDHPYGTQPTIGHAEHLATPAFDDMVAYFRRHYVPSNLAVVLAGDVRPADVLPVLERTFGSLPAGAAPADPPAPKPAPRGRVFVEVRSEEAEQVVLAWRLPGVASPDEPALSLFAELLGDGRAGVLDRRLVLPQTVPAAGADATFLRDAGYFVVSAQARPGQDLAQVEALLEATVRDALREGVPAQDLRAVQLGAEIAAQREAESNELRVERMTRAWISGRTWAETVARDRAIQRATPDEVVTAARRHLTDDRVVLYRRRAPFVPPVLEKPTVTPIAVDPSRESAFARRVQALPAAALAPRFVREGEDYGRVSQAPGSHLHVRNPVNELFAVRWDFTHGIARDPLLCSALALLEASGTQERDAESLARRLRELGARVAFECGVDGSGIVIEGIERHQDATLALVHEWLKRPSLDATTHERLLRNLIGLRRDEVEAPDSLRAALQAFAARGAASEYLRRPSNGRLTSSKVTQVAASLRTWLEQPHRTSYFGPRDASAPLPGVVWGASGEAPPPPRRWRRAAKAQIWFLHQAQARASVRVLLPHGPLAQKDTLATRVLDEYLGGSMASLLFQEIREARGLAYSAGGSWDPGLWAADDAGLWLHLDTQAEKTVPALRILLELLARPLDAARLGEARRSVEQGLRADRLAPRDVAAAVARWDRRGERSDPREREWAQLAKLDDAALAAFAAAAVAPAPIIVVMGDRERVNLPALRRIAPVQEVRPQQLFSYGAFTRASQGGKTGAGGKDPGRVGAGALR